MEQYFKEFAIYNDRLYAISQYNFGDKLEIDQNDNLIVEHPNALRWIQRKIKNQSSSGLIDYMTLHIGAYANFIDTIYTINQEYNDYYKFLVTNYTLVGNILPGLYRLMDYYCSKTSPNSKIYIKKIQVFIQLLTNHHIKLKTSLGIGTD